MKNPGSRVPGRMAADRVPALAEQVGRFPWYRTIVLLGAGLLAAAVLLGRAAPDAPSGRSPAPAAAVVSDYPRGPHVIRPALLDLGSGDLAALPLPPGEGLYLASCSPWADPGGGRQVAGLWFSEDRLGRFTRCGIGRFGAPDGAPLDLVESDVLPGSPPCWYPGTRARVLFASARGRIHRMDFEGEGGGPARPSPIAFGPGAAALADATLGHPVWPDPADFGGRLLVAALLPYEGGPAGPDPGARIWWLRLDGDGDAVVAAGRLTPAAPEAPSSEQPLAVLPEAGGGLSLVYRALPEGRGTSEIRVAPIRFDPTTGDPAAETSLARVAYAGPVQEAYFVSARPRSAFVFRRPMVGDPPVRRVRLEPEPVGPGG